MYVVYIDTKAYLKPSDRVLLSFVIGYNTLQSAIHDIYRI